MFRIVVFEEHGSGEKKIQGITGHGRDLEISRRVNIETHLPQFVDEPEQYIDDDFQADLVLDFLEHPDLSAYLARLCGEKNIPVIASGKKHEGAMTPFT